MSARYRCRGDRAFPSRRWRRRWAKRGSNIGICARSATLEAVYAEQLELPEAQAEARIMLALASERPSALVCYERDPCHCHRTLLIAAMRGEVAGGIEVLDLFA
jgi:hypothetical protein